MTTQTGHTEAIAVQGRALLALTLLYRNQKGPRLDRGVTLSSLNRAW